MTEVPAGEDPRFADLLDDLLTTTLDGDEPDLDAVAARHPAVADRLDEALELIGGVPGRRQTPRPSLQGYEIVREIGRGGMGTVYLARQTSLDREVAIKVLPHSIGLSPRSRPRFLAEARALAKVEHEHIVAIHRIVDEGEVLAFEMEFVDGPSLQQLLDHLRLHRDTTGAQPTLAQVAERLGLPPAELGARNLTQFFVRLAAKIASALGAVHAAGLIHRDVKPANILLRRSGQPVLVDFGLVRLTGREMSRSGSFAGTPVYSAPEQLRGDDTIGPTADVYGLGVTLYECLTLSTPFAGRTTTDQLRRIEEGRCRPLRSSAPGTPSDLETIVAHAMEIDGERRYVDGGAFADDLQRLLDLQPIHARPVGQLRRLGKFLRRNRHTLLAGSLGATLVAVAVVPILDRVQAATRWKEAARGHVQAAQQQVFSIESRHLSRPASRRADGTPATLGSGATTTTTLLAAIAEYERAIALDPGHRVARRERDVTRLALWLQRLSVPDTTSLDRALDGSEFAGLCAELGPCTIAAARSLARGTRDPDHVPDGIDAATDEDRCSAGLLGFLLADFRLCERAWQGISPLRRGDPLVSGALGLLYLRDRLPARAYAHLQQAQRSFPTSPVLNLALADAALANGDLELARSWSAEIADDENVALGRRRLELDLRAAAGDDDLVDLYWELAQADPTDPTPRHRIAQLAQRRGDLALATRVLDDLTQHWPEVGRFHLDRARLALQQRDLRGYARQALVVLRLDFGAGASRGTAADLLEVLRIGGLRDLHREGMAHTGNDTAGRAFVGGEVPIGSFAPPALAANFEFLVREASTIQGWLDGVVAETKILDQPGLKVLLTASMLVARLPIPGVSDLRWRLGAVFAPRVIGQAAIEVALLARGLSVRLPGGAWSLVTPTSVTPPDLSPLLSFGHAMCRIDDRTGDGIDDVLLSAPTVDAAEVLGRVFVVDGVSGAIVASIVGDSHGHCFGFSLADVGDVDGDGVDDWLVGAPAGSTASRTGCVELWSGGSHERIGRFEGGEAFGVGVAGLGDVDGDGVPDFAIASAPLLRNNAPQGSVGIYSGRTHEVLRTLHNDMPGVWFGGCIANAGDADGDGIDDVVVGGNYGKAPGLVRIYSAATGAVLQSFGDADPEHGFGFAVVGVGDLDGDGRSDIVVSSRHEHTTDGVDRVQAFSGRTGAMLMELYGPSRTDFGFCVMPYRCEPDLTLLAIGAPTAGSPPNGSVEFWTSAGEPMSTLIGPANLSAFGSLVLPMSDTDGDGRPELFVSNQMGSVSRISSRLLRFAR